MPSFYSKYISMKKTMNGLMALALMCMMTACYFDMDVSATLDGVFGPDGNASNGGDSIKYEAGVLTAAEWNDLDHWDFWCDLIRQQNDSANYASYLEYWGYQTAGRIGLQLTASGEALVGAKVLLRCQESIVWEAKTDNQGRAELWLNLHGDAADVAIEDCQLYVNDTQVNASLQTGVLNTIDCDLSSVLSQRVELLFMVDATGSMGDEMNFLKEDLMDVLDAVQDQREQLELYTAALFYRDQGDAYVVKHSDFTDKVAKTINYIEKQNANGGGDYPEAVHTAMETCVQLPWAEQAYARIAFIFLDAPAHEGADVLKSLHASVRSCARAGIKLIPVAASGVDKSTEFMLRYFAMTTCGTYVFLTDDSGVGNAHLKPSVGEYQVMSLNALMKNLILRYTE